MPTLIVGQMSTRIPSEEHKSCSKSQKQTCVEGKVVNELFKKLTKNGKNRVEKRNRHGKKTHLLREKRVDRWIGRVPV